MSGSPFSLQVRCTTVKCRATGLLNVGIKIYFQTAPNISINGWASDTIAAAPQKRFGLCEGALCRWSPTWVKTLYRSAGAACQSHRRKLNDPDNTPRHRDIRLYLYRGILVFTFTERQREYRSGYRVCSSSGNCCHLPTYAYLSCNGGMGRL